MEEFFSELALSSEELALSGRDDTVFLIEDFSFDKNDLSPVLDDGPFEKELLSDFGRFAEFDLHLGCDGKDSSGKNGVGHHLIQEGGDDPPVKDVFVSLKISDGCVFPRSLSVCHFKFYLQSDRIVLAADETVGVVSEFVHSRGSPMGLAFHFSLFLCSRVRITLVKDSR